MLHVHARRCAPDIGGTQTDMAPRIHSQQLETRTARLRLKPRRKPYYARVAPGIRVAYRRNVGAGTFSVCWADGQGGSWLKKLALADDYEDADGKNVLDFWQAAEQAKGLARDDGSGETGDRQGNA